MTVKVALSLSGAVILVLPLAALSLPARDREQPRVEMPGTPSPEVASITWKSDGSQGAGITFPFEVTQEGQRVMVTANLAPEVARQWEIDHAEVFERNAEGTDEHRPLQPAPFRNADQPRHDPMQQWLYLPAGKGTFEITFYLRRFDGDMSFDSLRTVVQQQDALSVAFR